MNTGIASSSRNTATVIDQVKSGIRISVTPGARMRIIIVRKLMAVSVEDAPSMICPATHRSVPGDEERSPDE